MSRGQSIAIAITLFFAAFCVVLSVIVTVVRS